MARRQAWEVSDQFCACGCGQRTMVSPHARADRGWEKGRPRRYVRGHRGPFRLRISYVRGARPRDRIRWVVEDYGFESPCWIWQLGVDVHGYGKLTRNGVRLKAHRVAYEDVYGPVPGLDVHHRCGEKRCVRPDHLEALTPDEHGRLHGAVWRRGVAVSA